jgi:hypothetical protein
MGIGTLRRYHKPVEPKEAPEVDPGTIDSESEREAAAEANAQQIAEEQQAQVELANAEEGGAESVAPIIQDAGATEIGDETPTVPVAREESDVPGDVSVVTADDLTVSTPVHTDEDEVKARREEAEAAGLNRGSSTKLWTAFDGGRSGHTKRDEIAEHYLGAKAE